MFLAVGGNQARDFAVAHRGTKPSPELIAMRQAMDAAAPAPDTPNVTITIESASGVDVWKFAPKGADPRVGLLHFHGGGFRLGSPKTFGRYLARVAGAIGATLYVPAYRRAPDAAFPSALEDALTSYQWLLNSGIPAERIVVSGDSAGGGLAASLLLKVMQQRVDRPAGLALFSPWLDLRLNAPSFVSNAATDQLFTRERAEESAALFLQGRSASDPFASPLLGSWAGAVPLLIQVSECESLLDDSMRLAARAFSAGVPVRLHRFANAPHVWHTAYPETEAAVQAIDNWRAWLSADLRFPVLPPR